jgi:hypothetical protein
MRHVALDPRLARPARLVRLAGVAAGTAFVLVCASCSGSDEEDGRAGTSSARADAGPTTTSETSRGPSCANGLRDGDETDVDCGGATCPACANGRACAVARDCVGRGCTGGTCTNDAGCSDGTREAFASVATFPDVAGCAGGWSVAGLATTTSPACARNAGNDSTNPTGGGCNVADVCQLGWHVCATAAEVAARSGGVGCAGASVTGANAFFAVRQSGGGGAMCNAGSNDLFGCGNVGAAPDAVTCAPLDRFSNDLCAALPPTWACGTNGADEVNNVTKTASEGGGVLCCRD